LLGRRAPAHHRIHYAKLEGLLAPEFVLASGRSTMTIVTSRAEWMKNSHAGPDDLRQIEGRLLRVIPIGENAAVAEVEQLWRGRRYFISDTWVCRKDMWQVVYRHTSPPKEPSAE